VSAKTLRMRPVNVRVTRSQLARVDDYCRLRSRTRSEVVRKAVDYYLRNVVTRPDP